MTFIEFVEMQGGDFRLTLIVLAASVGGFFHFKPCVECRLLALNGHSRHRNILSVIGGGLNRSTQHQGASWQ